MPKPIFKTGHSNEPNISFHSNVNIVNKSDSVIINRILRRNRTSNYMMLFKQLDLGVQNVNKSQFEAFINAIRNEFPDVPFESQLIGIVAKCNLGKPYEVHTLDLGLNIVEHYKENERMSPILERARSLAIHPEYEFIEVYVDSLRAIKANGEVSVAK